MLANQPGGWLACNEVKIMLAQLKMSLAKKLDLILNGVNIDNEE